MAAAICHQVEAGQDVALELAEGALLLREAAARAGQLGAARGEATWLDGHADLLCARTPAAERVAVALGVELGDAMLTYADRRHATEHAPLRIWVDRERARFSTWYEMFPRSAGPDPSRSATFREAAGRLAPIADLGFDVAATCRRSIRSAARFRKGRTTRSTRDRTIPEAPGRSARRRAGIRRSSRASARFDDFDAFRREAERLGLEVALDLAWQCSPDHPWVREHPEWFRHRPDGTIKYAENPPKKYQDIYPLDFANSDWPSLWHALLDVTRFWIARGVRIFRVDNPHTKTFGFWEWLIATVQRDDPDVIFLSEAFTRPKLMRYLAKAGFTQSYTYFTWRNTKHEIEEYLTELTSTEVSEYLRPNLFANTPDILHAYLQEGGRPAFEARLVLAATLSASYGIYSGFELCDNKAVRPGSEEYLDSEKYQIRHWNWERPGNITHLVRTINAVRRQHPSLQWNGGLRFCETDNPQIVAFTRTSPDESDALLVVVNVDPHYMQHGHVRVPVNTFGLDPNRPYRAHDLLTDTPYAWSGEWNYVRLDPGVRQAHVLTLSASDSASL